MIASIVFLWGIIAAALAEVPLEDGAQPSWSMSNISLTVVDHSTPQENMQIAFHLDYPNKSAPLESRCYTVPSAGPMAQWKTCGADNLRIRTTNVKVTNTLQFDLHLMKYSWYKDSSKNNTKQVAEIQLDYAKTKIIANSPAKDNMLECKLRRQDKDLKCQRGDAGLTSVKVYPQRSKLIINPLTVRNVTLSGPYPDSQENCTILFDFVNPNREAVTKFNAENEHQLRNRKRDFGFCQYSFPCGPDGPQRGSLPNCPNEFGHDLYWTYSINDLGIITMDATVRKSYNLTVGATETRWHLNLRADRQNCGRTCVLNCGTQCGQCSNGVCSWGGFDRIVDNIAFMGRRDLGAPNLGLFGIFMN